MKREKRFGAIIAILVVVATGIVVPSGVRQALSQEQSTPPSNNRETPSNEEAAMRDGEIGLSGFIVSVDATRRSLRLKTLSFVLPNGKASALKVAKIKDIVIGEQTSIRAQDSDGAPGEIRALGFSDLKPSWPTAVVGRDLGAGKALPARLIQVTDLSPPTELRQARSGFQTQLTASASKRGRPVETPTDASFQLVRYPAASGELAAYLTPDPNDGKKHPAIVWITGSDSNSIGDVWSKASRLNDQTAAAFRKAGIVMMFPSLRGGNDNPGAKEGFPGEVNDVLAAARFLAKQKYVDARRIYLGGHSTGGTLALLVAEYSPRFRGVFAFGAVADVSGYGQNSGLLPFDISSRREVELRSPGYWLSSIQSPVWAIEGTTGSSNIDSLQAMERISTNPKLHFAEVKNADHFNVLAPTNELLAQKILQDTGDKSNITFSTEEVSRNFAK